MKAIPAVLLVLLAASTWAVLYSYKAGERDAVSRIQAETQAQDQHTRMQAEVLELGAGGDQLGTIDRQRRRQEKH